MVKQLSPIPAYIFYNSPTYTVSYQHFYKYKLRHFLVYLLQFLKSLVNASRQSSWKESGARSESLLIRFKNQLLFNSIFLIFKLAYQLIFYPKNQPLPSFLTRNSFFSQLTPAQNLIKMMNEATLEIPIYKKPPIKQPEPTIIC